MLEEIFSNKELLDEAYKVIQSRKLSAGVDGIASDELFDYLKLNWESIYKIIVSGGGTHYFNKINEHYIDLTSDQFDLYNLYVDYSNNEIVKRSIVERMLIR